MRPYNFSAGPAMLPLEVLEQVRAELTDFEDGASVMEVSHRGASFMRIAAEAEQDLRELLEVPSDYEVLFMQGGATAQFALVPLNLTVPDAPVDYIDTGYWSKKAIAEARRYCRVRVAGAGGGLRVPRQAELTLDPQAAFVHYTPNETIDGVEFGYVLETGAVPLIADFSSSFLSQPTEVSRFGLIYAGAQKNLGPSGLTVVIVRRTLLKGARADTPLVFDYRRVAEEKSLLNTPPTFAWYVAGLVLKWLKRQGGLAAMAEINRAKAQALYAAIDASALFRNEVPADSRSRMNVIFTTGSAAGDERFIEAAGAAGLKHLKGHRARGGMRASLYNAMPLEGVLALVEFMREFERRYA